jgi:pyridoxine kinase
MKRVVKRVAAIHDLAGFGRCSLSVIMPILSTMGIQACAVPTAILSTHTGGYKDFTFVDLTDTLDSYFSHWVNEGFDFDCIYTGFLGSEKQIDVISSYFDKLITKNGLIVIDPVMADGGQLYQSFDYNMVNKMRKFISYADIITPNLTEASLLLDEDYNTKLDDEKLKNWLIRLSDLGPEKVIITSVPDNKKSDYLNVVAYDKKDNRFWKLSSMRMDADYPGTGDAFTSVLVGSLINGDSLPIALDRSVQFIISAIRASFGYSYPEREGVLLEKVLGNLNMPVILSNYSQF